MLQVLAHWHEQGHKALLFTQTQQMLDILEGAVQAGISACACMPPPAATSACMLPAVKATGCSFGVILLSCIAGCTLFAQHSAPTGQPLEQYWSLGPSTRVELQSVFAPAGMTCGSLRQAACPDSTCHALMQPWACVFASSLAVADACSAATTDKLPTQINS